MSERVFRPPTRRAPRWLALAAALGCGAGGLQAAAQTSPPSAEELARRLEALERRLGDVTVGVTGIAEAARWDDVANTLRVGGYGTLDARVSWRFSPGWTLQANMVNALDKRYETSAWYNQPGREYTLSLRWQPE